MQLSIVFVNWNSGRYLLDALSSIKSFSHSISVEVIVVDNASTDDSVKWLREFDNSEFNLHIIPSSVNLGFGAACNLGTANACGEYLLFLNPDAAIFVDTLPAVLTYMQDTENSNVGICGVQLLDASGSISRSCARFPTAWGLILHAVGIDRLFPRLGHFMSDWDHNETRYVDHVIGAFFFMRKSLFLTLHGFDERYFVYLEDLDFSLRAHQLGWRSVFFAGAKAFHIGGGASDRVKAHRLFYSLRSRLLYAFKNLSKGGAFGVLFASLFIEPFSRLFFAGYRHSLAGVVETLRAYGMLWRWMPRWILRGETR
jgi:GT2 family glycosyltransferase